MSVRRTWNKEAYAAKAKERLKEEDEDGGTIASRKRELLILL